MNSEPKATPAAHDSGLSLETEPLAFFHPTLVGLAAPGKVQPVPGPLLLEEEPAIWPQLGGSEP
jgi:hypothetical protein